MHSLWKTLLGEFVGTFTLVTIGCGAIISAASSSSAGIYASFAFGLALIVAIYTWGSQTGGHFNPAFTMGVAACGGMDWIRAILYWIVQFLAAICAAAVLLYFFGSASGLGASVGTWTSIDALKAVLLEGLLTFLLTLVFLCVTKDCRTALIAGFAVGLSLTACMLVAYNWTGGSFNPARSLGPAIFTNNLGTVWIYLLGPLVGGLLAGLCFRLYHSGWCGDNSAALDTMGASEVLKHKVSTTVHNVGTSMARSMPVRFDPSI